MKSLHSSLYFVLFVYIRNNYGMFWISTFVYSWACWHWFTNGKKW